LQCYIWFIAISFVISSLGHLFSLNNDFIALLIPVRLLSTLLFVLWFALRFLQDIENRLTDRALGLGRTTDLTNINAVVQLSRIILVILALLMALQVVGISISAILTVGSVSIAVFGFAAKDMLSNFLGGMIIYWDRPFSVGDWIRSPDRDIEGIVERIGWRVTRVRTLDKRPLYVPNGVLTTIALENPSRMTHRRIKITVGVRYSDAHCIVKIVQAIETMLRENPEIDNMQTISVGLSEFAPSSLNILIYAFTKTVKWGNFQPVRQAVFLNILDIINKYGAECAFPTQTLSMPEGIFLVKESKTQKNISPH